MSGIVKGMFKRGTLWWLRFTVNGKQERVSLGTEIDSLAAMRALERLQSAPLLAASALEVEIEEYFNEMRRTGRLSVDSLRSRKPVFAMFVEDTGARTLRDLTTKRCAGWLEALRARGVAPVTVESYCFRLRAFCRWLKDKHKIVENPLAKIGLPVTVKAVRTNFVTPERVRELILDAPSEDLRYVLYGGFHAGMRYKELAEARRNWVVFGQAETRNAEGGMRNGKNRRGMLMIGPTPTFTPKNKKSRVVPLTREFEDFLKRYMEDGKSDNQIPMTDDRFILRPEKEHGRHRWRVDLRRPFNDYMRAKGVRCSFHDMRRSFSSNKMSAGISGYKGAVWTGDGFQVFQSHYGHLAPQDDDIEAGI